MTVTSRRLFLIVVLLVGVSAALLGQQRTNAEIAAELQRLAAELLAGDVVRVPSGGDLQGALTRGGRIELEATGAYTGNFVARVPGTRLRCNGARLVGARGGHAIVVPPGAGVRDIQFDGCEVTAPGYDQAVIRLGANDSTQTRLEDEPSDITLTNVRVPTHRGKRAFEINARNVTLTNCSADDVWDPALRDSQAIAVLNSSGGIRIVGGQYVAASENIMVGGDSIKLVGLETTGVLIENVDLVKPEAWRTDGVNRNYKNLLELKAGVDVTIRNVRMRGSWTGSQTAEGLVITPRDRRVVGAVLVEDSDIRDVGSGIQILGRDYTSFTNGALRFLMRRTRIQTDHRTYGGQGRVATISGEPAEVRFTDNLFLNSGDSSLYVYIGNVMNADGTSRRSAPLGLLAVTNNRALRGQYGLFLNGYANGGPTGQGLTAALSVDVSGNTWGGDAAGTSVMRLNFPTNTYLSRAAFDALIGAGQ
jgi:hypothetical protein